VVFIYYCFGGTHSSVVTASLHLGLISNRRIPTKEEILKLPNFDKLVSKHHGRIFFIGRDEKGNKVYTMGCRNKSRITIKALKEIARIYNINIDNVKFINTISCVNLYLRIGGYLSRTMGMVSLGRPLVVYGVRKAFFDFVKLANKIKNDG
jgi:hypothetical protein